jgi:cation transport ATPase
MSNKNKKNKRIAENKTTITAAVKENANKTNATPESPKLQYKKRMIGMLAGAVFFAVALLLGLWLSFNNGFKTWQILVLFVLVISDIVFWILFYIFKDKYKLSLEKKQKKSYGSGNRNNRRKNLR